jgi:outer membrane autotransporter protein
MVRSARFTLRPLSVSIRWVSLLPLLSVSHTLLGATIPVDNRTENINAASPANSYNLTNNATLNVNGGVQHERATVNASSITLSAGSAMQAVDLTDGSSITMTGATISQGLSIGNSTGSISGSTLTSTANGLLVNRVPSETTGSSVTFTDSTSTGGVTGALVTHFSELDLLRSELTGTGSTGVGLRLNAGVARAVDSRLTGTVNGVLMASETTYSGASLTLDGTDVVGQNGAAISFRQGGTSALPTEGVVDINNGSTLIGGNGVILEVLDAAKAIVNVNNSALTGNVLVGEASTADLNFTQASLTGDVQLEGGSRGALDFVDSSLTGNVLVGEPSTADLNFTQASLTGDVQLEGGSRAALNFVDSSLTGNLQAVDGSMATLDLARARMTGNVNVDATSTADLRLDQSIMTGDLVAEAGGVASLTLDNDSLFTGRLENTRSLAINTGSQWVMADNASLGDLSMDRGAIRLGDAASFYTLSMASLSGNGTFLMDVDFGGAQTDFIDITGSATGSHSLLIGSTGSDPVEDTSLHVVHAGAGDAEFSLAGGAVDLGTWSYDLVKQGANDWYLDATTRRVAPGAQTIIALFNTAPTVWYGELTSLRTRMGELRTNGGRSGGWMRTYGNKFNVADASGFGYTQQQQGVTLGADGILPMGDGQWLAGLMAGQSKSDLSLDRGAQGNVDSYYVGAYSTWLDSDSGYYIDGVLKLNRFKNTARVNLSDGIRTKGDYDNSGLGASVEVGRHIKLDDNYYVEPYTQLAGVIIEGKDYQLDNGMRAEGDRTRSLLGKVGATVGRNFDLGQGRTIQPYVRAAVAHEFAKNNRVAVNNNVFNNDLSGSRGELGTGIAVALSDTVELHADFEYSNGDKIEQPWGANVGFRYNW